MMMVVDFVRQTANKHGRYGTHVLGVYTLRNPCPWSVLLRELSLQKSTMSKTSIVSHELRHASTCSGYIARSIQPARGR